MPSQQLRTDLIFKADEAISSIRELAQNLDMVSRIRFDNLNSTINAFKTALRGVSIEAQGVTRATESTARASESGARRQIVDAEKVNQLLARQRTLIDEMKDAYAKQGKQVANTDAWKSQATQLRNVTSEISKAYEAMGQFAAAKGSIKQAMLLTDGNKSVMLPLKQELEALRQRTAEQKESERAERSRIREVERAAREEARAAQQEQRNIAKVTQALRSVETLKNSIAAHSGANGLFYSPKSAQAEQRRIEATVAKLRQLGATNIAGRVSSDLSSRFANSNFSNSLNVGAYARFNRELEKAKRNAQETYFRLRETGQAADRIKFERARADLARLNVEADKFNRSIQKLKRSDFGLTNLKNRTVEAFQWNIGRTAESALLEFPSTVVEAATQYESLMAGVAQVLPKVEESQAAANEQFSNFVSIASKYGQSMEDTINAGRLIGRMYGQGDGNADLGERNTNILTMQAAKMATADNFSMAQATKGLESAMSQFNMQTENSNLLMARSSHILDVWTTLAHKSGASAQDLTAGVQKAGAAAHAVGVSFDFLNAMIATGVRSTAMSGAEIGNMIKSVFSSVLNKNSINALKNWGVEFTRIGKNGQKELLPVQQIILNIADALKQAEGHKDAKDISQFLLAISGGKYQTSKFKALLSNANELRRTFALTKNSAGFTDQQVQIQMDTVTRKLQTLKANLAQLFMSTGQSGLLNDLKWFLNIINNIVVGLHHVNSNFYTIVKTIALATAGLKLFGVVARSISANIGKIRGAWQNATKMPNTGIITATKDAVGSALDRNFSTPYQEGRKSVVKSDDDKGKSGEADKKDAAAKREDTAATQQNTSSKLANAGAANQAAGSELRDASATGANASQKRNNTISTNANTASLIRETGALNTNTGALMRNNVQTAGGAARKNVYRGALTATAAAEQMSTVRTNALTLAMGKQSLNTVKAGNVLKGMGTSVKTVGAEMVGAAAKVGMMSRVSSLATGAFGLLSGASRVLGVALTFLRGAVAALGGPVGAVITLVTTLLPFLLTWAEEDGKVTQAEEEKKQALEASITTTSEQIDQYSQLMQSQDETKDSARAMIEEYNKLVLKHQELQAQLQRTQEGTEEYSRIQQEAGEVADDLKNREVLLSQTLHMGTIQHKKDGTIDLGIIKDLGKADKEKISAALDNQEKDVQASRAATEAHLTEAEQRAKAMQNEIDNIGKVGKAYQWLYSIMSFVNSMEASFIDRQISNLESERDSWLSLTDNESIKGTVNNNIDSQIANLQKEKEGAVYNTNFYAAAASGNPQGSLEQVDNEIAKYKAELNGEDEQLRTIRANKATLTDIDNGKFPKKEDSIDPTNSNVNDGTNYNDYPEKGGGKGKGKGKGDKEGKEKKKKEKKAEKWAWDFENNPTKWAVMATKEDPIRNMYTLPDLLAIMGELTGGGDPLKSIKEHTGNPWGATDAAFKYVGMTDYNLDSIDDTTRVWVEVAKKAASKVGNDPKKFVEFWENLNGMAKTNGAWQNESKYMQTQATFEEPKALTLSGYGTYTEGVRVPIGNGMRLPAGAAGQPITLDTPEDAFGGASTRDKRRRWLMHYITSQGGVFTPEVAAGIVGNWEEESMGFNPTVLSGDGRGSQGLGQWTDDRKDAMKAYAASAGRDWRDFRTQAEFGLYEITKGNEKGNFAKALNMISNGTHPAIAFREMVERPGEPHDDVRVADYGKALNDYNATSPQRVQVQAQAPQVAPIPAEFNHYGFDYRVMDDNRHDEKLTNLENVKPFVKNLFNVVATEYMNQTGQKLLITGGAEHTGGHQQTAHGHGAGYKLDISDAGINESVLASILDRYGIAGGHEAAKNHYDLSFSQGGVGTSGGGKIITKNSTGANVNADYWANPHSGAGVGYTTQYVEKKMGRYNWKGLENKNVDTIYNMQFDVWGELVKGINKVTESLDVFGKSIETTEGLFGESEETHAQRRSLAASTLDNSEKTMNLYKAAKDGADKAVDEWLKAHANITNMLESRRDEEVTNPDGTTRKKTGAEIWNELTLEEKTKLAENENDKNFIPYLKQQESATQALNKAKEEYEKQRVAFERQKGLMTPREEYEWNKKQLNFYDGKNDEDRTWKERLQRAQDLQDLEEREYERLKEQADLEREASEKQADVLEFQNKILQAQIDKLKEKKELSEEEAEDLKKKEEQLRINDNEIKNGTESYRQAKIAADEQAKALKEAADNTKQIAHELQDFKAAQMTDIFDKLINQGETFRDVVEDIRKEIAKIALRRIFDTVFGNPHKSMGILDDILGGKYNTKRPPYVMGTAARALYPPMAGFGRVMMNQVAPTYAFPRFGQGGFGGNANNAQMNLLANSLSSAKNAILNSTNAMGMLRGGLGTAQSTMQVLNSTNMLSNTLGHISNTGEQTNTMALNANTVALKTASVGGGGKKGGGGLLGAVTSLLAEGGKIPAYAGGGDTTGLIHGAGNGKSDSILTYLAHRGKFIRTSNGEFIMRKEAVDTLGVNTLNALNESPEAFAGFKRYAEGGNLGEDVEPVMSTKTVDSYNRYNRAKGQMAAMASNEKMEALLQGLRGDVQEGNRRETPTQPVILNTQADSASVMKAIAKNPRAIQKILGTQRSHGFR